MSEPQSPSGPSGLPEPAAFEAPAWVSELLASLREDDPPTPDDVIARTDAALAALRHADPRPTTDAPSRPTPAVPAADTEGAGDTGSAGSAEDTGDAGDTGDDAESTDRPGPGAADVVPIGRGRRHARGTPAAPWGHRLLLGGVAAAAVLVLGGLGTVAVLRGNDGTAGPPLTATDTNGEVGQVQQVRYVASGEDYTESSLSADVAQVLSAADGVPVSPQSSALGSPDGSPHPLILGKATTQPSATCLKDVLGGTTDAAVLVDEARFTGRPAYVIIVRLSGSGAAGGSYDIWVVSRPCTTVDKDLITYHGG